MKLALEIGAVWIAVAVPTSLFVGSWIRAGSGHR